MGNPVSAAIIGIELPYNLSALTWAAPERCTVSAVKVSSAGAIAAGATGTGDPCAAMLLFAKAPDK
jgi:hypothetical protein